MKNIMKTAVAVMTLFMLILAVFATRQVFFKESDFGKEWVNYLLIAIMFAICAVLTVCLVQGKFSIKRIGFYLLHTGLIIMLAGGLIYFINGIKINGVYPVNRYALSSQAVHAMEKSNRIKGEEYIADFNSFDLGVSDLKVEYYEPVYDIYRIGENGNFSERLRTDIEINGEGYYDFGEYGLKKAENGENIQLDGNVYAVSRTSVKSYLGTLNIRNHKTGEKYTEEISINHPLRVNGWKIYLMAYSAEQNSVTFTFKYDPAEYIILTGIWAVIIGSFLMSFARLGGKEKK